MLHQNRIHHPQKHKHLVLGHLMNQAPKSPNNAGESLIEELKSITVQHNSPPGKLRKHRPTTAPKYSSSVSMKSCSCGLIFHLHNEKSSSCFSFQACTGRTTQQELLYTGASLPTECLLLISIIHLSAKQRPPRYPQSIFTENIGCPTLLLQEMH